MSAPVWGGGGVLGDYRYRIYGKVWNGRKGVESYLIGRSGSEKLHRFKGEWSPKIAKDLYCLLSKKRIK